MRRTTRAIATATARARAREAAAAAAEAKTDLDKSSSRLSEKRRIQVHDHWRHQLPSNKHIT